MKWIAARPDTAAATIPTTSGSVSTWTPPSPASNLRTSKIPAPAVIGVAIRNANRAADSRSMPTIRAAEIEIPDRLMPGISARAWAAPMPIAIGNVTSSMPRDFAPNRSAINRIRPPMTSVTATSPTERNDASMTSLSRKPMRAAGTVDAASSQASRRSSSSWNERSRTAAIPAGTRRTQSLRK